MGQPNPQISTILNAAARARQAGSAAEELRLIEQALQTAPGDPHALNARGMYALAHAEPGRGRDYFAAAADADPGEPALWMNLSSALRALGDNDGEEASLNRALSIDRLHFTGQLRMAELYQRTARATDAAQSWSNVVQLATGIEQRPPAVEDALTRGRAYLAAHHEALSRALDSATADTIAKLGGGARRFSACVDHSLGRRAIYQNHCSGVHYPFLPADEFFDRDHFPWFEALEARTEAIAREAVAMLETGAALIRPYVRMDAGSPETKWTGLDGSLDWSACFLWEYGVRNNPVCDLCPETAAALAAVPQTNIPGKAPSAFFSILRPGAHIPPHTGVTNTRAIIHLPLIVPDGCRFRVGGETREWRVGEAFAFDDTIEHEAWNESDKPRIILIFDVWNPHLTVEEQELLTTFYRVADAIS